jgi:hypothetical protein
MKKRVKLDLSWRTWSLIVGFFILLGFIGLSFAYGGANPSVMGHSYGELGIPTNCANDEVLKYNSSSGRFVCGSSGTGVDYIVETERESGGSRWYRKWNSGLIEQGGILDTGGWPSNNGLESLSYLRSFTQTPALVITSRDSDCTNAAGLINVYRSNLNGASLRLTSAYGSLNLCFNGEIHWYASGF